MNEIAAYNAKKFHQLVEKGFPAGQYAITSSGPLGVRGLREIGDVDVIVKPQLWKELVQKYPVLDGEVEKIKIPETDIEVVGKGSLYTESNVEQRIDNADILGDDYLPFDTLDVIIDVKRRLGRPKDLRDIELIEVWQKTHE